MQKSNKSLRILIVEDEAIVALCIQAMLVEMGFHVVGITDNGKDAFDLALSERPDVILMDIVLKGNISGIEATELIRPQLPDCKIIYVTAHTDEATHEKILKTRHSGFLYKPVESFQVKSAIEAACTI